MSVCTDRQCVPGAVSVITSLRRAVSFLLYFASGDVH